MKGLEDYLVPYTLSQIVSVLILIVTWKNIRWGRVLFSILFLYAGVFNMRIGLVMPDEYLGFADLAIPPYRDFILGWFAQNNHIVIPVIAVGQLLIGIGFLLHGWWVKWAGFGSILFLVSIAPLLVGSAFPFSLTVSVAAYLIVRKDNHDHIWKKTRVPVIKVS